MRTRPSLSVRMVKTIAVLRGYSDWSRPAVEHDVGESLFLIPRQQAAEHRIAVDSEGSTTTRARQDGSSSAAVRPLPITARSRP